MAVCWHQHFEFNYQPKQETMAVPMPTEDNEPSDLDAVITSPAGVQKMSPSQELVMDAALIQIDQRMTHRPYLDRAENTFDDIRRGEITDDALVNRVQQRFAGGTVPNFSKTQAQEVLNAINDIWRN